MREEEIVQRLNQNPQLRAMVDQIAQQIAQDPDVTPEMIDQLIKILGHVLQNPQSYPELRQQMIREGAIDEEDLPVAFNEAAIVAIIGALYLVKHKLATPRGPQGGGIPSMSGPQGGGMPPMAGPPGGGMATGQMVPGMARGGLASAAGDIRERGRGGDTILAHISPFEAELLQSYGGSGRINPNTGLPEFGFFSNIWKSVKKVFKAIAPVLPVLLSVVAPGIGTAIGGAIGLSGVGASIAGSAILGGATSAITGGNVAQGATLGALGGGLGTAVGGALGLGSGAAANIVGSGVVGGGLSAAMGKDIGTGALQGLGGGAIGSIAQGAVSPTSAVKSGLLSAGQTMGNALTAQYKPAQAATMGALSGLASGIAYKPSSTAVEALNQEKDILGESQARTDNMFGETPGATEMTYNPETGRIESMAQNPYDAGQIQYNPSAETQNILDTNQVASTQAAINNLGAGDVIYDPGGNPMPGVGQTISDSSGQQFYTQLNPSTGKVDYIPLKGGYELVGETVQWVPENPGIIDSAKSALGIPTSPNVQQPSSAPQSAPAKSSGILGTGISTGNLLTGGLLLAGSGMLGGSGAVPEDVQPEINKLTEEQQEYFEQPGVTETDPETGVTTPSVAAWDWTKMKADATASSQSLSDYMAQNWDKVSGGQYTYYYTGGEPNPAGVAMARGGALGQIAGYAKGSGSGRADTIDARLSDGEYVIDAETVALLGDGSSEAGARVLNQMRAEIRKQKGKALAKGKISPDAKSPLTYIKERSR